MINENKTLKTERLLSKLGALVMALLGFSSCSKSSFEPDDYSNPFISAYGVPTASYQVKGTVRNENGKVLGGIQVAIKYGDKTWARYDTTYTNSAGTFSRTMSTYPEDYIQITYNDVDGPANDGEYQSQTVSVKVSKLGDGKGPWNHGTYKAESIINLKKK